MYFKWEGAIFTLNDGPLKLEDKFMYLGSCVEFTESDVNMRLREAWTVIDSLLNIWKSDLFYQIKLNFFYVAVVLQQYIYIYV